MIKIKIGLISLILSINLFVAAQSDSSVNIVKNDTTIFLTKRDSVFSILKSNYKDDSKTIVKIENFKKYELEKILIKDTLSIGRFLDSAKSFLNTPYCYGGSSRKCTDCSGFLYQTFKTCNVDVPHSSDELARFGFIILEKDSLKAGDLVFFIKTYNTSKLITHSAIYLGNGEFIHASSKGVIISTFNEKYYKEKYIFGTRIFN